MNEFVKWEDILSSGTKVYFSTLAIPDIKRSSLNREVTSLQLASGLFVDIEWNDDEQKYVVTLYRDNYEDWIVQPCCDNPSDVLQTVKTIEDQYGIITAAALRSASSNTADCSC